MYRHRIARAAALGLALGALAAPTAGAQPGQHSSTPDARDAALGAPSPQNLSSPDARDAAEGRYLGEGPQVVIVTVPQKRQSAPANGIDWAAAGIGAGGLLGLSLIGCAGALFVVHRRRAAHHETPAAGL
jgi:hypothetical protein